LPISIVTYLAASNDWSASEFKTVSDNNPEPIDPVPSAANHPWRNETMG